MRDGGCTYGLVDGIVTATAQAHVGESTLGAAAGGGVLSDEVDAGDDTGPGALGLLATLKYIRRRTTHATAVGKNLDSIQLSLLSNTIGGGANGASNVSTVAITIIVIAITAEVLKELGALVLSARFCKISTEYLRPSNSGWAT